MHPDGRVARKAIVGAAPSDESDGPLDLVVVSASSQEDDAVRAAARLTPDGVVCVLGAARFRARMRKRLEGEGLAATETLMVLPRKGPPHMLVPLRTATVRLFATRSCSRSRTLLTIRIQTAIAPLGIAAARLSAVSSIVCR